MSNRGIDKINNLPKFTSIIIRVDNIGTQNGIHFLKGILTSIAR